MSEMKEIQKSEEEIRDGVRRGIANILEFSVDDRIGDIFDDRIGDMAGGITDETYDDIVAEGVDVSWLEVYLELRGRIREIAEEEVGKIIKELRAPLG